MMSLTGMKLSYILSSLIVKILDQLSC